MEICLKPKKTGSINKGGNLVSARKRAFQLEI